MINGEGVVRSMTSLAATVAVTGALLVGQAAGSVAGSVAEQRPGGGNAVVAWNATAGEAALATCIAPLDDPLHESRMYATMHIAVHDAVNAIERHSLPYVFRMRARGRTSVDVAVAAAARDTLVAAIAGIPAPFPQVCRDAGTATVEAAYAAALAGVPDGAAKTRGVTLGRAAAAAVIALRADDGSDTPLIDTGFPQGSAPGQYRFTPGTPFAFAPGWGQVSPFTLDAADQFRPGPPQALGSRRYARDLNEVKRLGGDGLTTPTQRTAAQTQTALFWWESSPLAWNRIARTIAADRNLDVWQSARLFGLLDMALADGYIASFDTKYHDLYWRPVTAIQEAGADGNPATTPDPTWTPLRTTPPIPEHDSAHAVQGAAAAAVIREFFGTDEIAFSTCSRTLPAGETCTDPNPVTRHYTSLSQAARENGVSRILIGYHFRTAVRHGIGHGTRIGTHTFDTQLRPAD